MTFYRFVMKILRRFHLKYALGTSNYLLLGRGGGVVGATGKMAFIFILPILFHFP